MAGPKRKRGKASKPRKPKRAKVTIIIPGGELELVAKCLDQLSAQLLPVALAVHVKRQRTAVREFLTPYLATITPIISEVLGTEDHNGIDLADPRHPEFLEASVAEREEEHEVEVVPILLSVIMAAPDLRASVAALEVLEEYGFIKDEEGG